MDEKTKIIMTETELNDYVDNVIKSQEEAKVNKELEARKKANNSNPDVLSGVQFNNRITVGKDLAPYYGAYMIALAKSRLNKQDIVSTVSNDPFLNRVFSHTKAMSVSDFDAGGSLVNQYYDAEIIPLLSDKAVVRAAGAIVKSVPHGILTLNKMTGGMTAYYRHELGTRTNTNMTTGQMNLSLKEAYAELVVSDEELDYASYNLASEVQKHIVTTLANKEDESFLLGTGADDTPKGIGNWAANTIASTGTTVANVKTAIFGLKKLFAADEVLMDNLAWFMHPSVFWGLADDVDSNSNPTEYAISLRDMKMLYGSPVYVTTKLPTTTVYAADMGYCVIGEYPGGVQLSFDPGGTYTDPSDGTLKSGASVGASVFRAKIRHDFVVTQGVAAGTITSVTW